MKSKFLTLALILGLASFADAQTWASYTDKSAKFKISLPAVPAVTEDATPGSPSRIVKADYGDYTNIVKVYELGPNFAGDPYSRAADMIMAGVAQEAKLVRKSDLVINGKKGLRALFFIPSQQFYLDKGVVIDGKFAYSILQIRSKQDDTAVADKIFSSINQ